MELIQKQVEDRLEHYFEIYKRYANQIKASNSDFFLTYVRHDLLFIVHYLFLYKQNISENPNEFLNVIRCYVPHSIIRYLNIPQRFSEEELMMINGKINLEYNRQSYFQKCLIKFRYKNWELLDSFTVNKIMSDFNDFVVVYNEMYSKTRKNFINHELVLYFLLKHNNVECCFDRLKMCHIHVCKTVFEKLGWCVKDFILYNKMETVQNVNSTSVIEELRSLVEELVTLYTSKNQDENTVRALDELGIQMKSLLDELFANEMKSQPIGKDTCDPQTNTCAYVVKKGKNKGSVCGKKSKSNFCAKHSKRIMKEESESD